MFIKSIKIENFRLFSSERVFEVNEINVPDTRTKGSGLTVFIGENACGKSSLLDAFALPLLSYKVDSFSLSDFFNPEKKTNIQVLSQSDFEFSGTMPKIKYKGKGFVFEAGVRSRDARNYLSSIVVSDQRYIRADGETKPEDGKPDLRVSVNNPWSGVRFNENDFLFLDKNRTYQTRSGTYNPTRFDRLMEDFDFQYLKQENNPLDCNEKLKEVSGNVENQFLKTAINKFKEISGKDICLAHINNWLPHSKSFFCVEKENKQHITLDSLGSGYEMIFSLLYSFYLSQQSNKQLIVFIDEPELHLHPRLQEDFVKILLEFSKTAQIILTSHSPLFVKQVLNNENVKVNVLKNENEEVKIVKVEGRVLSYLSSSEINFIAFDLPTEEYHNELFEELKSLNGEDKSIKQFDKDYFIDIKHEIANSPWRGNANEVSVHTFIRNQIHHQKDNGKPGETNLKQSIEKMRGFLSEDRAGLSS
jgi:AAA15 family ATPase/GTPase